MKFRFHCPLCGMMADIDRVTENGPYPIEAFIQYFGGKTKDGRGFIKYVQVDVPPEMKARIAELCHEVLEMLGEIRRRSRRKS